MVNETAEVIAAEMEPTSESSVTASSSKTVKTSKTTAK